MIAVTILYPRTDDATFEMDYYAGTHMPLFAEALGDACRGWGAAAVDGGRWTAMGWLNVESREAFDAAMAVDGAKILGDVPNYTNTRPELVIGEVVHTVYSG